MHNRTSRLRQSNEKERAMTKANFLYTIYIAAAPENVWNAFVDGDIAERYWGHRTESDWKSGSPWRLRRIDGSNKVQIQGMVAESEPPVRIVFTWAYPDDADLTDRTSRVTITLDHHLGESTKLTLLHDDVESGSKLERDICSGWPLVLSNLKSFLECGKTVPLQSANERAR